MEVCAVRVARKIMIVAKGDTILVHGVVSMLERLCMNVATVTPITTRQVMGVKKSIKKLVQTMFREEILNINKNTVRRS